MNKRTIILYLFSLSVFISYLSGYCQEKQQPPPPKIQVPDSLRKLDESKTTLPTINLQEIVITGRRRVEVLDSRKLTISPENTFFRAPSPPLEGRLFRKPEPLEAGKQEKITEIPVTGTGNEAYLNVGKYLYMSAGLRYKKAFEKDVLYVQSDYKGSNGHIDNAGFQDTKLLVSGRRELSEGLIGHVEGQFSNKDYKFYGSEMPEQKRTRLLFSGTGGIEYKKLNKLDFTADIGARVGNLKDFGEISESGFSFDSDVTGYLGKHVIKGGLSFQRDNLTRNDETDNLQFLNGHLTMSFLLLKDFLFRFGGNFYAYQNTDGTDASKFYPDVGFNLNLKRAGELFFNFSPRVLSTSLSREIKRNRFLIYNSPLAFKNEKVLIQGGWRKKASTDLSIEFSGNYRKIENYGIYLPGLRDSQEVTGLWRKEYGTEVELKEMQFSLFYNPFSSLLIWFNSSYRIVDFTENSSITGKVPYIPTFENDILLIYSPGAGFELKFDGIFANQRYYDTRAIATLNQYFLWNFIVGKKINKNLEINATFYNIFNHRYSYWNGYVEPDFITSGGFKYYW